MMDESATYNSEAHAAAPIQLSWVTRNGSRSNERWIFIRCCGQIGHIKSEGSVEAPNECSALRQPLDSHHPGQLELLRSTRAQVTKNRGKLPIARWTCCGQELDTWDDSWGSRDGRIPWKYVANGCREGLATDDSAVQIVTPAQLVVQDFKLAPQARRRAACLAASHGRSSGTQQEDLGDIDINPMEVRNTQETIHRLFSDGSDVLETIRRIKAGALDVASLPKIRVAYDPSDICYSADNRRLFVFKVLGLLSIQARRVTWTKEFTDKLNQHQPSCNDVQNHLSTSSESIDRIRAEIEGDQAPSIHNLAAHEEMPVTVVSHSSPAAASLPLRLSADGKTANAAGMVIAREAPGGGDPYKYLVLQHKYGRHWALAKGHVKVNNGETWRDCAVREVKEETGLHPSQYMVMPDFEDWQQYRLPKPTKKVPTGVKVVVNALALLTDEMAQVHLSEEHVDCKWLCLEDACKIVQEETREVLQRASGHLSHLSHA